MKQSMLIHAYLYLNFAFLLVVLCCRVLCRQLVTGPKATSATPHPVLKTPLKSPYQHLPELSIPTTMAYLAPNLSLTAIHFLLLPTKYPTTLIFGVLRPKPTLL